MIGDPNTFLIALGFLVMLVGVKLAWTSYLSTGTGELLWFPLVVIGYGFGYILFAVLSEPLLAPEFGTSNTTAIQHVAFWIGLLSLLALAQFHGR